MHNSIWTQTEKAPKFEELKGDVSTDVLVIGGGITGILIAHKLKESGVDCVVAEADEICGGVTKDTTAKITLQHGLIYADLIRKKGKDVAKRYLEAQTAALAEYRALAEKYPCDFKECDSLVYALNGRERVEREAEALGALGCPAAFEESVSLPVKAAGAVRVSGQAQFHPLKLLYALAKQLPIYHKTKILALAQKGALTPYGRIRAEKIVVATHFPFLNKHGFYFLKMYQHRSYVLALEGAELPNAMCVDESDTGLSFRHSGDVLLLGGGGHRTGKNGGNWRELEEFAGRHYPGAREVARWATQDCITLDRIPYIGRYGKSTDDLFVATGFNKWGMTSAMVSAILLRDMILGRRNDWQEIFSPSRSMLTAQLATNILESTLGLMTPTVPRCPHLGCALKYNRQEHSWDCPCHGSRFGVDGKLLDNPATGDKRK